MKRACILFLNKNSSVTARLDKTDIINARETIPDFDKITKFPYRFRAHVFLDNTKIYMCPDSANVISSLNVYNPNSPIEGFILDDRFDEMSDDEFELYLMLNTRYNEEVSSELFQNKLKK